MSYPSTPGYSKKPSALHSQRSRTSFSGKGKHDPSLHQPRRSTGLEALRAHVGATGGHASPMTLRSRLSGPELARMGPVRLVLR